MKEKIYTIPVTDALHEDSECFVCELEKKLEQNYTVYELGPAMMEEDNRMKSDEAGFCKRHFDMMYSMGNRLSMGLVLSTHLKKITEEFESCFEKGFFSKKDAAGQLINYIGALEQRCVICEKIKDTMQEYVDTIFYLWDGEKDFKQRFKTCKGLCIPHVKILLEGSKKYLNSKKQQEFLNNLHEVQSRNLSRIQEEIEWFIKKFDYRYHQHCWGNSQDAVPRTIEKVSGYMNQT